MESLAIPVLGLAVIDAINPSALAVALMLGAGAFVHRFGGALEHPVVLAVQLAIGLVLFAYAVFAPKVPASDVQREPRGAGLLGMALLGATVTLVELTTALPYFAAVALMTAEGGAVPQWLPLLLAYNVIFVAPPLVLVALNVAFGRRLQGRFAQWRTHLQAGAREAGLWVMALAGVALCGDAVSRYLAHLDRDRASLPPIAEAVSVSPSVPE